MSEDVLLHFTSNSSNQSDQSLPSKIAKLEARMVGKTSTAVMSTLQIPAAQAGAMRSSGSSSFSAIDAKFGANAAGGISVESLDSSDSEEDSIQTIGDLIFFKESQRLYNCILAVAHMCGKAIFVQRMIKKG